jgi:hypothetical protein
MIIQFSFQFRVVLSCLLLTIFVHFLKTQRLVADCFSFILGISICGSFRRGALRADVSTDDAQSWGAS